MTTKKIANLDAEQATAEVVKTLASVGKEIDTVMKFGNDAAAEGYKNAAAYGQEQRDMTRTAYDKAISYGKDNMEAMSHASALSFVGAEACFTEMANYTRTAVAENLDLMQRLFVAKSPQEFLDIRLEAADKSVTSAANQTTKINQIATESMIKACDPIKTRMDNAMESFLA